ncbi:unnamed protein product [Musa hybrid cultivar]
MRQLPSRSCLRWSFDCYASGAEGQWTLKENRAAFSMILFRRCILIDQCKRWPILMESMLPQEQHRQLALLQHCHHGQLPESKRLLLQDQEFDSSSSM